MYNCDDHSLIQAIYFPAKMTLVHARALALGLYRQAGVVGNRCVPEPRMTRLKPLEIEGVLHMSLV